MTQNICKTKKNSLIQVDSLSFNFMFMTERYSDSNESKIKNSLDPQYEKAFSDIETKINRIY